MMLTLHKLHCTSLQQADIVNRNDDDNYESKEDDNDDDQKGDISITSSLQHQVQEMEEKLDRATTKIFSINTNINDTIAILKSKINEASPVSSRLFRLLLKSWCLRLTT